MKKICSSIIMTAVVFLLGFSLSTIPVQAQENNRIEKGIYIGSVDVAGMTAEEAAAAVRSYVEGLGEQPLQIKVNEENTVSVKVADIGITWANDEVATEAVAVGKIGNIVQRFKALQDLEYDNKVYEIELAFDREVIRQLIADTCSQYNVEAKDATLVREGGSFQVIPGQVGTVIDEEASIEAIYQYMTEEWNHEAAEIALAVTVDEPKGTEEELAKVKDVLGTFSTGFKSSNSSRTANVTNGCNLVAGATIYPGDEFSMYEAVSPFSVDNGYHMAGSYLNGKVVDSLGGGICQVSTTLYNSVLLAELEVTERHNHSMSVSYVDLSADAAIAESAGKDFKFKNNTNYPIYIDGYVQDKVITFTIYGVEERPANRKVEYVSETVSVTNPDTEVINTNEAIPIGTVSVDSAHIGYKAKLWKVVTEDGVEVSREQVNSSSYKMVPRTATVGLSTPDVNAYNEMVAAVATNNIDHVKNVAAAILANTAAAPPPEGQPAPPAPAPAPEAPPPEEPAPVEGEG